MRALNRALNHAALPLPPLALRPVSVETPVRRWPLGARVVLTFVAGPLTGRSFEYADRDVFVFGRGSDCHASVPDDPYLSRHHFVIDLSPPLAVVRDLGSRNGTRHNARRLGGRRTAATAGTASPAAPAASAGSAGLAAREAVLRHGDVVRAGRTELHVSILADGSSAGGGVAEGVSGDGGARPTSTRIETVSMGSAGGETVGGYTLVQRLGTGSSGVTWLARDGASGREVALKLVTLSRENSDAADGRIEREVDLLSALEHRNVVRLLREGRVGDTLWLALEFCDAGSLGRLLAARGALPWDVARPIALDLLDGLAHAHRQIVVHRDMKPDNVLLASDPAAPGGLVAKVADFGLAKFAGAAAAGPVVTMSGSSAGTPEYMPREQILQFRTLRPPSDVWSAAATIYRMLAGASPREPKAGQDVIQTILEVRATPLAARAPAVPRAVADVIDRGLVQAPEERWPDAGAMAAALRAAG